MATIDMLPVVRDRLAGGPTGFVLGDETDVPALAGSTLAVENPSTGSVLGHVAAADAEDVDRAVALAREAVADRRWSAKHPGKKSLVLETLRQLLEEHLDEFAQWEALDAGIPIAQAPLQVYAASGVCHHYSGWPTKLYGELNPLVHTFHSYTVREPVGVVAVLAPWNQPLVTVAARVAPALAAGNCVILKASRRAPYSAVRFGELALEAGLPPGVLTVLTGDGETAGSALARHPGIDTVAYVGSRETGARLRELAAPTGKQVLMELGGKSPNIVFPDADLDRAADSAAVAVWRNAGQIGNAGSRLLVERSIHDKVVDRVVDSMTSLTVGSALDPGTHIGPLISAEQRRRVGEHLRVAEQQGAKPVLRGAVPDGPGYGITPAVFTDVDPDSALAQDEVFGPVLAVTAFDDEDHALALADNTRYGLGAGVWTSDVRRVHRFAQRLRAGTVWANVYGMQDVSAPVGGFGASGVGADGGREWINAYTRPKAVFVSLL
ncbi:aldehyde dehydrogenase family protein [Saccharomonospora piscinae]|uniref:aldehyde dehydrogenase family protein n=1 Tax=Saccharomonospora piscinae TaxID=687388 RepID=UPI0004665CC5|nr:aldehyde dehydrogenase family protein [Saccharomonospora piscinae]